MPIESYKQHQGRIQKVALKRNREEKTPNQIHTRNEKRHGLSIIFNDT